MLKNPHILSVNFNDTDDPDSVEGGGETILIHGFIQIEYSIKTEESRTEIQIYTKRRDYLIPEQLSTLYLSQIITPLIYLRSLEKGLLIMHSAGVSEEGRAHVFPAEGGTGKTTLLLNLVDQGMKLYGDDLVTLSKDGLVYPYPRPLHLFYNHLHDFRRLSRLSLSFRDRFRIYRNTAIRKIIQLFYPKKIFLAVRVPPRKLGIEKSKPYPLSSLLFITRRYRDKTLIRDDQKDLASFKELIIKSSDLNNFDWDRFLPKHRNPSKTVRDMELRVLSSIIDKTRILKIHNITDLRGLSSLQIYEDIGRLLNDGVYRVDM